MGPTRSRSTRFLSFAFLAMLWLPDPHWPARDSTGNGLGPEAQDAAQQAETQAAVAPEIIGQLGGAAKAVAADASDPTRAYLGLGPRVIVLDISGPAEPIPIGESPVLPAVVADLVVAKGFAYAATRAGLSVIDLRDPAAPILTDQHLLWPWTPESLWGWHEPRLSRSGSRLFLVSGREDDPEPIRVFDIEGPGHPEEIHRLHVGEPPAVYARDIAVEGDRAVVMLAGEAPGIEAKLAIFELPAEGEPRLLGLHENAAPVHAIALRDRQLWISDERCTLRMGQLDADGRIEDEACARLASTPARRIVLDEGLAVLVFHASIWFVDGSRPERPDFIATASVSAAALDGLSGGRSWLVATASGGIQVVGIEAGDGLQVLSSLAVGDPGQTWKPRRLLVQGEQLLLSLLGGLATIDLAAPGGPRRLALDTDHAGIPALAGGNGWIAVVDERDLGGIDILAPSPDGQLEHLARIEIEGRPIDLGASADRLVVLGDPDVFESAPISRRYLEVFDLTDAWTPRPIGKQAIRLANQVQVSEGRAYTSGGGFVEVFDIDGADIPAYLGHLTRAGEGCAGPRRGFLYCGGGSRYAVIDVRDPATMQPVPGIQTDLACPRPELAAGELYCGFNARGDGGWRFDLGDPARPRLVGYAGGLGRLHAAASYGEQVLLLSASPIQAQAEHRLELAVVQQGTPARTSQAPAWQGVAVPGQIAIAGSRAYLTLDESSQAPMLGTIDISTPTAPRLIAQLPLAFEPWQLAADASLVYLTTGLTERVHVFDMRSPDSPIELPSIELESVPYSIAAADGSLWVGGETGLTGYSVDPETGTLQELGHLPSRRALGALDDGGINTLSVQGSWVFAADQLANGSRRIPSGPALILAVDIGDPRSPVVAETHQAPSTRYRIYGLASESKQLLVDAIDRTTWLGELWFIDMEAPDQARLSSVWRADTSESAIGDIALRDGLAFAYLGHSGIAVLGTDLEPEPRLLKQIVLPGDQNDSLTLADDGTLWTTDWEAGLIALRFDRDALPTPTPGATPTRRPLPTAAATSTPGGAGTELPRVLEAIYLPLVHH